MHFDENPFTSRYEKENKKAWRFQILHFHWSFSSDIMAVKGLKSEPNHDRDNFNGDGDDNDDVKYGSDT